MGSAGRGPGELLRPVRELPLQHLAGEPSRAAGRVVGVLHFRLGERRLPPGGVRLVEGGELPHQHPRRPSVRRHVVQGEQEGALPLPRAYQQRAEQRPALQVEGAEGLLLRQRLEGGLARGRGEPGQLHLRGFTVPGDGRPAHPVPVRAEGGAQRLVRRATSVSARPSASASSAPRTRRP